MAEKGNREVLESQGLNGASKRENEKSWLQQIPGTASEVCVHKGAV